MDGKTKHADHRLSLDHRGRPDLLHRPQCQPILHRGLSDRPSRPCRDRPDLGYELPHQLHAGRGAGLHRATVLRIGPDSAGQPRSVCDIGNGVCRPRAAGDAAGSRARSIWIRPSATTSRSCRATRPIRYNTDRTADRRTESRRPESPAPAAMAWAAPRSPRADCVTVWRNPPFRPAKLSVFVFEDDFPLNGEQDGGGGIDVLSPNEPGLGASTSPCSTTPAARATPPAR